MTRTALAFSPHLDDAAFSCGATLATLAAKNWRVVVATAFTASVEKPAGFALACQLDKGLSPDVDYMALRRAEDAEACRLLGVEAPVWLPFREAPHRGYGSAPELFAGVRPDDEVDRELRAAFEAVVEAEKPDLLLAPQAVGGHADHVQVVQALRNGVADRLPMLWWTDFPYAVRADTPRRPFADAMRSLAPVGFSPDQRAGARKRDACRAYASQIGYQFGGADGLDRRLAEGGGAETFRLAGSLPDDLDDCLQRS